MELVLKQVQRKLPKGSHKGRQAAHNATTGKYFRQRVRTTHNKQVSRDKHLASQDEVQARASD